MGGGGWGCKIYEKKLMSSPIYFEPESNWHIYMYAVVYCTVESMQATCTCHVCILSVSNTYMYYIHSDIRNTY